MRLLRWFENWIDPFRRPPQRPPPTGVWGFYWYFIRQAPLPIGAAVVTSVASQILGIIVVVTLGRAVDQISGGAGSTALQPFLYLIPALLLVSLATAYFNSVIRNLAIVGSWNNLIRWQSHQRVIRRGLPFFQRESSGRIGSQVAETANSVVGTVVGSTNNLLNMAVILFGMGFVFAGLHWSFLLPLAGWLAGYAAIITYLVPRSRKASSAQFEGWSRLSGRFVDTYANIVAVKLFGGTDREDENVQSGIRTFLGAVRRTQRLVVLQDVAITTLDSLLVGAVFIMALLAAVRGTIPVGDLLIATALVLRLQSISVVIVFGVSGLMSAVGTVEAGMKTIAPNPPDPELRPRTGTPLGDGGIAFRDVVFGYQTAERVLDGLSFEVPPRHSLGIVGLSGAGKSTILNLLARLYVPERGSIAVGGRDVAAMSEADLWDALSVVTQDPLLFNRSVRDNVVYGRPDATEAELAAALAAAGAAEFVAKLVDADGRTGVDVQIGERGVRLSGGQRQRIAIARALLKDAPVMVLDEPTSALDSETEAAIQETLATVRRSKTLLVIAHRVSTIADLDRIIVLDKGRVVEAGSHAELVRRGGIYQGFWQRQTRPAAASDAAAASA